jgi:DNA-binding NarL/FixJ family response regulator
LSEFAVAAGKKEEIMLMTEIKPLRVLIADDHKLLTDLLEKVLEAESDIAVMVAGTFDEARRQIVEQGGFDVVLLDLKMPGMTGLDSVLKLAAENRDGATVIMSGAASSATVKAAIEGGIRGFIPKAIALRTLPSAIRLIASGEIYVPHDMINKGSTNGPNGTGEKVDLTDREMTVLRLAAEGQTNKSIAWEIGQTEVIVKMVMRNICAKLGAQNRTQASMIAMENGII